MWLIAINILYFIKRARWVKIAIVATALEDLAITEVCVLLWSETDGSPEWLLHFGVSALWLIVMTIHLIRTKEKGTAACVPLISGEGYEEV